MRCLKTRTLLGLFTAGWLIGVIYFLSDVKRSDHATHDGDSYLEEYDKFLDGNTVDNSEQSPDRIDDSRVSLFNV